MKISSILSSKVIAVATVLLALNGQALSLFSPTETRVKAYGDSLYSGVGILNLLDAGPKHETKICTAFLISRQWAVTAAHCVATATAKTLFFEFDQGTGPFEFQSEIVQSFSPSDFSMATGIFPKDWALLQLKTPAPARFKSYSLARPAQVQVGQEAIVVGYPRDIGNGDVRMLSEGCTVRNLVGDQIYSDCDILPGNSGGPLLVKASDGSWIVAGITSTQTLDANQKELSRQAYADSLANHFTNLSLYVPSLAATIKANPL